MEARLTPEGVESYGSNVLHPSQSSIKDGQEFESIQAGGLTWRVRRACLNEDLQRLLEQPDEQLDAVDQLPLSERPATSIRLGPSFFLKRYNRARLSKLLKSVFRTSPADRAFRAAAELEHAGLPTPRALAVTNKRFARVLFRSYLVTESIAGAITLEENEAPKAALSKQVAEIVARLHELGFVNRDLNLSGILFDQLGCPHVVDLDKTYYVGTVSQSAALADLARFSLKALDSRRISTTDRARFLRLYCRLRGQADWRFWWRRIEKLNQAEYIRLARKGKRP